MVSTVCCGQPFLDFLWYDDIQMYTLRAWGLLTVVQSLLRSAYRLVLRLYALYGRRGRRFCAMRVCGYSYLINALLSLPLFPSYSYRCAHGIRSRTRGQERVVTLIDGGE